MRRNARSELVWNIPTEDPILFLNWILDMIGTIGTLYWIIRLMYKLVLRSVVPADYVTIGSSSYEYVRFPVNRNVRTYLRPGEVHQYPFDISEYSDLLKSRYSTGTLFVLANRSRGRRRYGYVIVGDDGNVLLSRMPRADHKTISRSNRSQD